MTFEDYLKEIGDSKRPLATARMAMLSRLAPDESLALEALWPRIDTARKERIGRSLIELAEDNVELDFEGVFLLCLDDPTPSIRVLGIEGLVECLERWFMERLIAIARTDPSEEVRSAAAGVEGLGRFVLAAELGDLRSRDAQKLDEALLSIFDDEKQSPEVRRRALESVGARCTPAASAAITSAYASPERELHVGALYAMGRSADEKWLNTLLAELTNPDPEIRYEAVTACGEIEDERALPYIAPLLKDNDLQVRIAAVIALGHIGGPRARHELMAYANSSDDQMRAAAEEALEEITLNEDPLAFGLMD